MYHGDFPSKTHSVGAVYRHKETNRLYVCIEWCNAQQKISVMFFDGELAFLDLMCSDFDTKQASNLNEYWKKERKKANNRNRRRRLKKSS